MFRQEGEGFQLLDTNNDGYMEMYHYDGKTIYIHRRWCNKPIYQCRSYTIIIQ